MVLGSVLIVPPSATHATLAGFKSVQEATGWVDFNADGRTDYCGVWGSGLRCRLSTGTGFGQTITLSSLNQGQQAGRAWADFNGDGRADYCRVIGSGNKNLSCTVSNGTSFGTTYTSGAVDPGYNPGRAWADFNGDGRADYCRVVGTWSKQVQCTLSTGTGFGATYTSGNLDAGWDAGRAWVDVNGDNRADFCRVVGYTQLQCTISTGNGFGTTFTSGNLDAGYNDSRRWADFNGDGRADFCRNVGNVLYSSTNVRCTMSTGNNFGASVTSPTMDAGYTNSVGWVDFNGDGRDDYCRMTGNNITGNNIARCTISNGTSFGVTYAHQSTLAYGLHGWGDLNGDGRADHGVFSNPATVTLSTGTGWSSTYSTPNP